MNYRARENALTVKCGGEMPWEHDERIVPCWPMAGSDNMGSDNMRAWAEYLC